MRGFLDWKLGLLAAACVAALAAPAVGAAEQDDALADERAAAEIGQDAGAGGPGLPAEEPRDAEAAAGGLEPGALPVLAPIATESVEANANVDLPQDI